ncbi:MAG: D-arabinono-1,4-lactone oxidase [Allosphingosinicella sp.]
MDQGQIIQKGSDGYYHPKSEDEVVALVKHAAANGLQIRVRGASHSTAWSIFTDPVNGKPVNMTLNRTPPAGPNMNLAMDKMIGLDWIDEAGGIVEAEAGIHLGADPYDAIGEATLQNSLLYQIFEKGWALNDLGGITHQTISGFTATGSAGGSLKHDLNNVAALRIVDGRGEASWIERDDPIFGAAAVSMGLLGIVTKLRLKLKPTFRIEGREDTTPVTLIDCPIDLFGGGSEGKPSLQQFLQAKDYSRIMWWPQKGAERVVIWQANRIEGPPPLGYKPVPYKELATDLGGWLEQLAGAIVYLLLGNKGFSVMPKLLTAYARFVQCVAAMWGGGVLAVAGAALIAIVIFVVMAIPTLIFILVPTLIRGLFPTALNILQPMTGNKPVLFDDYYWRSLPMDNTADDILLGTEFTEIWIPLQYTQRCMNLLNDMFVGKGEPAVGFYSTEIYATMPSQAWLSPAYSNGSDEYKDGVVRFDVFWYRGNEGEPNAPDGFYRQYWDLFRDNGIPFRFHWGKFVPAYDFPSWAEHYRRSLPMFDDFLKLRAERDPKGIFFTRYWRERFTGQA